MSTQLALRASSILAQMPAGDDNHHGAHSTLQAGLAPIADPVADGVNNARFAVSGTADNGGFESAFFTARVRQSFSFTSTRSGSLSANAHFMAQGSFSLVGRQPTWIFDGPGSAAFSIFIQMRLGIIRSPRSTAADINLLSSVETLFSASTKGVAYHDGIATGIVHIPILSRFLTLPAGRASVGPGDQITVEANYTVRAFANDGASFVLDFSKTTKPVDFSDGLNSPLAAIHII